MPIFREGVSWNVSIIMNLVFSVARTLKARLCILSDHAAAFHQCRRFLKTCLFPACNLLCIEEIYFSDFTEVGGRSSGLYGVPQRVVYHFVLTVIVSRRP